jgi:hypothetical protein
METNSRRANANESNLEHLSITAVREIEIHPLRMHRTSLPNN